MKKVYEAKNTTEAYMIADMLEKGGIQSHVKGEHDSLSPATVWILDDKDHAVAIDIISAIPTDDWDPEEILWRSEPQEMTRRSEPQSLRLWHGFVLGVGAVVVVMMILSRFGVLDVSYGYRQTEWDNNRDGRVDAWAEYQGSLISLYKEDENHDGEPDNWFHYEKDIPVRSLHDSNFDGKVDTWRSFEGYGAKETTAYDANFDGKADSWEFYESGMLVRGAYDNDFDGKEDSWGKYENASLVEEKWSFRNDGVIDKITTYHNRRKTSERYDQDRDGQFEKTIYYDAFERVVSVEEQGGSDIVP